MDFRTQTQGIFGTAEHTAGNPSELNVRIGHGNLPNLHPWPIRICHRLLS